MIHLVVCFADSVIAHSDIENTWYGGGALH